MWLPLTSESTRHCPSSQTEAVCRFVWCRVAFWGALSLWTGTMKKCSKRMCFDRWSMPTSCYPEAPRGITRGLFNIPLWPVKNNGHLFQFGTSGSSALTIPFGIKRRAVEPKNSPSFLSSTLIRASIIPLTHSRSITAPASFGQRRLNSPLRLN